MTTLREFVLAGSTLPSGATIREHLKNQKTGSGSGIDRTFNGIFESSINSELNSSVESVLNSSLSSTELSSDLETVLESQVE